MLLLYSIIFFVVEFPLKALTTLDLSGLLVLGSHFTNAEWALPPKLKTLVLSDLHSHTTFAYLLPAVQKHADLQSLDISLNRIAPCDLCELSLKLENLTDLNMCGKLIRATRLF